MRKIAYIFIVIVLALGIFIIYKDKQTKVNYVPVLETAKKGDLITVENPKIGQAIHSPIVISGQARGTWYFEASFPVVLLDGNGNTIATDIATAKDDWMTENYVPFISTLTFTAPQTATGTLILKKDNPSGDPARDNELRIPVSFTK